MSKDKDDLIYYIADGELGYNNDSSKTIQPEIHDLINNEDIEKTTKENNQTSTKENSYNVVVEEDIMPIDEQIKFYIEKGKSFMLHGLSGVGKTRRIEEADPDFVSIVLRNGILPEEVIGKTIFLNDENKLGGKWSPPAWYVALCEKCEKEPNKNHVLFVDEITNVKPSEQSLVFHLILNNSIGPNIGQLPKNVVVVAAGNNKEESEAAYNMPEPLYRRFEGHIELKPEIRTWIEWGSAKKKGYKERLKIHPLVSAFVGSFGSKVFYTPYDTEEPPKFAIDPRGWEQISNIIYDNNGIIRRELIENKVGREITSSFLAFAKNPPLSLKRVITEDYTKSDIPTKMDAKYALAMSFRNVDETNVKKVREFIIKELGTELLSTFDATWVGEDNERAFIIAEEKKNTEKLVKKLEKENSKAKNTITLSEFWNSREDLYIRCSNYVEINNLCIAFNFYGEKWASGDSYLDWGKVLKQIIADSNTDEVPIDNYRYFCNNHKADYASHGRGNDRLEKAIKNGRVYDISQVEDLDDYLNKLDKCLNKNHSKQGKLLSSNSDGGGVTFY